MSGFTVFARKEAREIRRTWRLWVLPSIVVFFAASGPVVAKFTPQILGAVAADQLGQFQIPTPTYLDAYGGWIKNLSQITLFALIIVYGGIVSAELKSGTAVLVLTKPVSRTAFIVAKAAVHSAYLAVLIAAGTLLTWGVTAAAFGSAPGSTLWAAAGTWLAFGILFVAIMTLLSVLIPAAAGAAGAGLGVYALLSIAGVWEPLGTYSPAALTGVPTSLALGKSVETVWPVCTALLLAAALVALAVAAFKRKEL